MLRGQVLPRPPVFVQRSAGRSYTRCATRLGPNARRHWFVSSIVKGSYVVADSSCRKPPSTYRLPWRRSHALRTSGGKRTVLSSSQAALAVLFTNVTKQLRMLRLEMFDDLAVSSLCYNLCFDLRPPVLGHTLIHHRQTTIEL
jgi:hypothetical protein